MSDEDYLMVQPVLNVKVRDPRPGRPKFLPENGALVPNDTYWRNRIKDGDVVVVEVEK